MADITFEQMLAESLQDFKFTPDEIIEAEVLSVNHYFVTVDAGLHVECSVPRSEFLEIPEVGDKVQVIIEAIDDGKGQVLITHEKALERLAKDWVHGAIEEGEITQAKVKEATRAGLLVKVGVLDGFLPNSLIDVVMMDKTTLLNKVINVKIVGIDPQKNNVIVNRKAAIIEERGGVMEKLMGEISIGDVREGIIKNILHFGAFVDLGGVDCMMHVSDMQWDTLGVDPLKDFEIGQRIKGVINKKDDRGRLFMSLKHMDMSPWEKAKEELNVGDEVVCEIYKVEEDYSNQSVVVSINGVMGRVSAKEFSWTRFNPKEIKSMFTVGEKIKVTVVGFNEEEGKEMVELSIKANQLNPWDKIDAVAMKGSVIQTKVKAITDYAIFIPVTDQIDAIIPLKEIDWNNPNQAIRELVVGQEVDAKIMDVDKKEGKITASLREVKENPLKGLEKGGEVSCTVREYGLGHEIYVDVDNNGHQVPAIIRDGRISKDSDEKCSVGAVVEGTISYINSNNVVVSLKRKEVAKKEKPVKVVKNGMTLALEEAMSK